MNRKFFEHRKSGIFFVHVLFFVSRVDDWETHSQGLRVDPVAASQETVRQDETAEEGRGGGKERRECGGSRALREPLLRRGIDPSSLGPFSCQVQAPFKVRQS